MLIENERKLAWAGSEQILIDLQCSQLIRFSLVCNQIVIENERKLALDGVEQILVDLQLNSNWK